MPTLKIYFQDQIKKLVQLPTNYDELIQKIQSSFNSQLSCDFELNYENSEGDKIILSNQDDYQKILEYATKDKNFIKIYIKMRLTNYKKEDNKSKAYQSDGKIREISSCDSITKTIKHMEIKEDKSVPLESESSIQEDKGSKEPRYSDVIHAGIKCDNCGLFPIVGIRYKCSVCQDFDLCETCEVQIGHIHPVLMLKKVDILNNNSNLISKMQSKLNNFKDYTINLQKITWQKVLYAFESVKNSMHKLSTLVKSKISPINEILNFKKSYDYHIINELKTIPEQITSKTEEVNQRIIIRNIGQNDFPSGTYLKQIKPYTSEKFDIQSLKINDSMLITLKTENIKIIGKNTTTWIIAYKNEFDEEELISDPFKLEYEVIDMIQRNDDNYLNNELNELE